MGEYTYLTGIIITLIIEYALFITLIGVIYRNTLVKTQTVQQLGYTQFNFYFGGDYFTSSYTTYGGKPSYFLLIFRICCSLFFAGFDVVYWYYKDKGLGWFYFTNWNLISIYFMIVTLCSLLGVCCGSNYVPIENQNNTSLSIATTQESKQKNYQFAKMLGFAGHVFFEVAGASALFVTFADLLFLNPNPTLQNYTQHVATSVTLLIEMLLNNYMVRWEHLLLNVSWAFLYLIYIWPIVRTGFLKRSGEWPYFFLDTSSPSAYFWYNILFVLNIFFYLIWYTLARLKLGYLRKNDEISSKLLNKTFANGIEEQDSPVDGSESPVHSSRNFVVAF
eukprot:gene16188-22014_t